MALVHTPRVRVHAASAALGSLVSLHAPARAPANAETSSPAPVSSGVEQATPPPVRVLMVTATAGYHHDSIAAAEAVVPRLGPDSQGLGVGLAVTLISDIAGLAQLDRDLLEQHDVLFFANTSGELPLAETQKPALLEFVSGGGGFVGAHAAADTLYTWPDYGGLLGAYFREHPWTQPAGIVVEDQAHPVTHGLETGVTLLEEFYVFRTNPRERAHVLLSLDAASVGAEGDFPLAWCSEYGAGRVCYTALGHFDSTWEDAWFQQLLLAALRWTANRHA